MNSEQKHELKAQAIDLAYYHILHSGLHKEFENNEEWDRKSQEWADRLLSVLDGLSDAEFTKIESERRETEAA